MHRYLMPGPLGLLITLMVLAASAPRAQAPGSRQAGPNILLLYADDWRHDTLGAAGHPVLRTPNLDRLAAEGIRFRRAYVTTSICGVSRASLLTGQWMSRHGNTAFDAFKTPWEHTYPGVLRARGYWTGHVGKWHNGAFPAARFDVGKAYGGTHFMKGADGAPIHVTRRNEADALEFLRTRPADRPFVLTVSFFATHAEDQNPKQYLYQPESEPLYRDATIPVPPTMTDAAFARLPAFIANEKNEGRNRWRWRFDTPEKYQQYMKAYYRLATEVDTAVGRVLAELRTQGLDDNTLVIFTTDNGYFHGEHGLADKWYPYEESIRVPLIVRDPRLSVGRRGSVNDDIVLNTDLAPTLLAYAGVTAPTGMQGRDMAPLYLSSRKPDWRDEFFYEHATIRSVDFIPASQALVRKDAKYIYWPDFDYEELFDLRQDPREERNLAKDAAAAGRLNAMRTRFAELKAVARSASEQAPSAVAWRTVWADEFDKDGPPDPAKWHYEVGGNGWGNRELQFYTDGRAENARVERGLLIIEARKEEWEGKPYTSARLNSRDAWTHGRIEVRAKLPRGRGSWPAIWMLPLRGTYAKGGWPDNGEIDIMEHVGFDPNVVHASVHTRAYNHVDRTQRSAQVTVPGAQDAFHVYAIEWTPEEIRAFVDDRQYFAFRNERLTNPEADWRHWPFDREFRLLLNIAVGGNWGGQKGVDETIWPQRMEIDYVRVRQAAGR